MFWWLVETGGSGKLDLAIVLDTSGSTRNDRFYEIQIFVADLIERLEIRPNKTQVAALHFNNRTQVRVRHALVKQLSCVIHISTVFTRRGYCLRLYSVKTTGLPKKCTQRLAYSKRRLGYCSAQQRHKILRKK